MPTEALAGKDRRDYFNHRRECDPLAAALGASARQRAEAEFPLSRMSDGHAALFERCVSS